jgi:hypothetical protein
MSNALQLGTECACSTAQMQFVQVHFEHHHWVLTPMHKNACDLLLNQGPVIEQLPQHMASRVPIWVLEADGNSLARVPERIEGEGAPQSWVEPRSCSDVWIPSGSEHPTMVPALAILVKAGVPRYIMPALDVYVEKGDRKWRNRGFVTCIYTDRYALGMTV